MNKSPIANSHRRTLALSFGALIVLVAAVAAWYGFLSLSIVRVTLRDPKVTGYQAFFVPVVERNGGIVILPSYGALPAGQGLSRQQNLWEEPWPMADAPLQFRFDYQAKRYGFVLRKARQDEWTPDNSDIRVFWVSPAEMRKAIRDKKLDVPAFESHPQFDPSPLLDLEANRTDL